MAVTEKLEEGWEVSQAMGGGARYLRAAVARLVWCAVHRERSVSEMPAGWMRGRVAEIVRLETGDVTAEAGLRLRELLTGEPEGFCAWVQSRRDGRDHPFDAAAIAEDLENLKKMVPAREFGL